MADIPDRLRRCFSSVFPGLSGDKILQASPETVAAWDSLMMVTLIAVIEEEFELTFEFDDIERLNSYSTILSLVERYHAAPLS